MTRLTATETRFVMVARRTRFERMERLETLDGDGPMIAIPDFHDVETKELLPEGVDLKTFAKELAEDDPSVVSVRPVLRFGEASE